MKGSNLKMKRWGRRVRQIIGKFELVDIAKIPRSENYPTDILARMTTKTDKKKKKTKVSSYRSQVLPQHRAKSGNNTGEVKKLIDGLNNLIYTR